MHQRAVTLGLLIASYPLSQFFGAPILGELSDKIGRKKVLIVSLLGTFIGYILFGFGIVTKQIWLLFFSRLVDGFTGGNVSVILSSISDISDEKSKTKNFGLVGMAFGLGFIIGPYIGGKLSDPDIVRWFNFATPFWFASLLSLINILLVIFRFKETLRAKLATKIDLLTGFKNIRRAFELKNLRVAFLIVFLLTFGFTFFTQFFQVFLIKRFSYNQSQIGELFAYVGIWIAITQGLATRVISHHYSPKQILFFSILFLALCMPLLLLPNKHHLLFFILPFIALFWGLTQPSTTALVSSLNGREHQGEILGINQSIQSLAFAIPPIIAGFIVSLNIRLPIILASFSIFLAWVVFKRNFTQKGSVV